MFPYHCSAQRRYSLRKALTFNILSIFKPQKQPKENSENKTNPTWNCSDQKYTLESNRQHMNPVSAGTGEPVAGTAPFEEGLGYT